jgi:hypothetical protein
MVIQIVSTSLWTGEVVDGSRHYFVSIFASCKPFRFLEAVKNKAHNTDGTDYLIRSS